MTTKRKQAAEEDRPLPKRPRRSKASYAEDAEDVEMAEDEIESPVSQTAIEEIPLRGEPPVWAEKRTSLCDTLGWFRSVQGDDEIVITRVGGGFGADNKGKFTQQKDLNENTQSIGSYLMSKKTKTAVGLIIGNQNTAIKRKMPHKYNVLGWFRVIDVWYERVEGKVGAQVRFQKLNLEEPSWWAIKGSSDPPPLSEREFAPPKSKTCSKCNSISNQVYEEGWMCLQYKCPAFWRLGNEEPPEKLNYHADFLNSREPVDDQVQPEFSLVPEILTSLISSPDAATKRVAWKGVVCPECHKCVSRRYWNGWVCSDPSNGNSSGKARCRWKRLFQMPVVSLRAVINDLEIGVTKRAVRIMVDNPLIQTQVHYTPAYQKFTYTIGEFGTVVHYSANRSVLDQPNGPNALFERLQTIDLGLRRYTLGTSVVEGTLTAQFAVNFGMPYKYVVAVDSKGFSEAPPEIKYALGRLTWATKEVVGEEALNPNELLALGYFEDMNIGYHDDGESSLGPTIATLSLGAKATMKIRLKDEYFRGRRRSDKLVEDDAVLPGCFEYEKRAELKEEHQQRVRENQQKQSTAENKEDKERLIGEYERLVAEYNRDRMELSKQCSRRESKDLITMDLHHGDLLVMHGTSLQKYYEHQVNSHERLRFALTARYVKPKAVDEKDRHNGKFELEPDQVYDGQ